MFIIKKLDENNPLLWLRIIQKQKIGDFNSIHDKHCRIASVYPYENWTKLYTLYNPTFFVDNSKWKFAHMLGGKHKQQKMLMLQQKGSTSYQLYDSMYMLQGYTSEMWILETLPSTTFYAIHPLCVKVLTFCWTQNNYCNQYNSIFFLIRMKSQDNKFQGALLEAAYLHVNYTLY